MIFTLEGAHHSVRGGRRSDTSYATCCCTAVWVLSKYCFSIHRSR